MKCLTGKCVSNQIVIAPLFFYQRATAVSHLMEETPEDACASVKAARGQAVSFCREMVQMAEHANNHEAKEIFEAQEMLLTDPIWEQRILQKISSENLSAVMAVTAAGEELKAEFLASEDEILAAKVSDVDDIVTYYLRSLGSKGTDCWDKEADWQVRKSLVGLQEGVIVMAPELTPSDTMRLSKDDVKGFVTKTGSFVSHVSILAGSLGIPALYGVEVAEEYDGCMAILDGGENCLIVNPDEETLQQYHKKAANQQVAEQFMPVISAKEQETDSRSTGILKYANVTGMQDAQNAFAKGAEGIGLFRSECLFLDRTQLPTEEEQFLSYKAMLELANGREVVIRVLDIGSDKICPALAMKQEQNPALGLRGIRYLLSNPEILYCQLRALYKAAAYGNLSILFPMITTMEEVREIKRICEAVRRQLNAREVKIGMMVETPAAALITDLIAAECDFISIGTNDLTQYLMATDRDSELADIYLCPEHPAVERLLEQVVKHAHEAGCKVCICGELAANPGMTERFAKWRVDVLSVAYPG